MRIIFLLVFFIIIIIVIFISEKIELEKLTCNSRIANFFEKENIKNKEIRRKNIKILENTIVHRNYCRNLILENCNNEAFTAYEICRSKIRFENEEALELHQELCRNETGKFLEKYEDKEVAAKILKDTSVCVSEVVESQSCKNLIQTKESISVIDKEEIKNNCSLFDEIKVIGRYITKNIYIILRYSPIF